MRELTRDARHASTRDDRRDEYRELCSQFQEEPRPGQWENHRRSLQKRAYEEQLLEDGTNRLTKAELHAWWRENYTQEQIDGLYGGIA